MNKTITIGLQIVTLLALQQCKSQNKQISEFNLAKIKQQYSIKAINYFYETVFFQDYVGPNDALSKWKNDIWIRWEGELWPCDSLYVKQAVKQINDLDLPINLRITKDTILSNLIVYFGNFNYLERKLKLNNYHKFIGIGRTHEQNNEIDSAKVGIANNARSYEKLSTSDRSILRQSVILEEIAQTLGVEGDSWAYHNSMFFEGKNKVVCLSDLDKEVIKLLYEPCIPPKYSKEQFEQEFQDILYHVNPTKKIISYAMEHNTSLRYLDSIRNSSFQDSILFKYSGSVFVSVEGDFQPQDLEFVKKAVERINTASDQFQLEMVSPNDVLQNSPRVAIQYNDSTLKTPIAERFLTIGGMMFNRRVDGIIKLSYNMADRSLKQEHKNKLLFATMGRILGLDYAKGSIPEVDSTGKITFNSDYEEILRLLYNPVFPPGFSQKEMEEVIAALKQNYPQ